MVKLFVLIRITVIKEISVSLAITSWNKFIIQKIIRKNTAMISSTMVRVNLEIFVPKPTLMSNLKSFLYTWWPSMKTFCFSVLNPNSVPFQKWIMTVLHAFTHTTGRIINVPSSIIKNQSYVHIGIVRRKY